MSKRFLQPYRLSVLQRSFLVPYFGLQAILDPTKGDMVAGFGDVTSGTFLKQLHAQIIESPEGRMLLKDKPLISVEKLNLSKLRTFRSDSLGYSYTQFMDHHGYSADERSIVRFMTNVDLAYTLVRYRQIHDFWHVLSGLPPTVLGELALKCFEFEVTGLPVCAISSILGQVQLSPNERNILYSKYIPWAIRAGNNVCHRQQHLLLAYRYEDNLEKSLDEVRLELQFEPAPLL